MLLGVRLQLVFFSVCRTVSCEISSTIASSTNRPARSRNVHLARPSGGSPHAAAIKCASDVPSSFRGLGGGS